MADMRERLIELIDQVDEECRAVTHCSDECKYFCIEKCVASKVADYLIENGVIVLPCKVGDTVYQLDTAGDIYESEITKIIYDTNGIAFDETAIGKSIFLTREDASIKGA